MKNLLFTLAVCAFFSGMAMAASTPKFQDMDVNTDGSLSKQEVNKVLSNFDFASADQNKDGALSEQEYQAAIEKQGQGVAMEK